MHDKISIIAIPRAIYLSDTGTHTQQFLFLLAPNTNTLQVTVQILRSPLLVLPCSQWQSLDPSHHLHLLPMTSAPVQLRRRSPPLDISRAGDAITPEAISICLRCPRASAPPARAVSHAGKWAAQRSKVSQLGAHAAAVLTFISSGCQERSELDVGARPTPQRGSQVREPTAEYDGSHAEPLAV